MNKYLAAALLAAVAAPVAAAVPTFIITPVAATETVAWNNEYKDALGSLGLTTVAKGAGITLSGPGKVTYTYVGSESGLVDTFTDGAVGPFAETNGNVSVWDPVVQRALAPVAMGSTTYSAAGALAASYLSGTGDTIMPGSVRFGVFAPAAAGGFSASTIYFSLDDRATGDGDFDDFIVKATISDVPEPAAWLMMIAGFGLVGVTARGRRTGMTTVAA